MRLWTIQTPDVLEMLEGGTVYRCDPARCARRDRFALHLSYGWMADRMDERGIVRPEGVLYPVWAWYAQSGRRGRPDLRLGGYAERGKEMACIEIEIDDDRALLSDSDDWDYVLNGWYLNPGRNVDEYWENNRRLFGITDRNERERFVRDSWERVLSVGPETVGRSLQAAFWELRPEDVVRARRFVAK